MALRRRALQSQGHDGQLTTTGMLPVCNDAAETQKCRSDQPPGDRRLRRLQTHHLSLPDDRSPECNHGTSFIKLCLWPREQRARELPLGLAWWRSRAAAALSHVDLRTDA